jgi:hypothetical protein
MNNEIRLRYFFFGPPLVCGGVSSGALRFLGDIRDAAFTECAGRHEAGRGR